MSWIARLSEVELPEPETSLPASEANAVALSDTKPSDWALSLFGDEAVSFTPMTSSKKTYPRGKAIAKRQRCTETWDCRRVSRQRLPKSSMTFFEPASEEDHEYVMKYYGMHLWPQLQKSIRKERAERSKKSK